MLIRHNYLYGRKFNPSALSNNNNTKIYNENNNMKISSKQSAMQHAIETVYANASESPEWIRARLEPFMPTKHEHSSSVGSLVRETAFQRCIRKIRDAIRNLLNEI